MRLLCGEAATIRLAVPTSWAVAALLAALMGGCRSGERLSGPDPSLREPKEMRLSQLSGSWCFYGDTDAIQGTPFPHCDAGQGNYTITTSPGFTLWHHVNYPSTNYPPNANDIEVFFGELVYRVKAGTGAPFLMKCGSEPSITVHGPGGSASRMFHSPFPNDPTCQEQGEILLQGGLVTDEVFMIGGINRLVISTPDPINWTWLCTDAQYCSPGSVPREITSSGVAVYGISWQDQVYLDPRAGSCIVNNELLDLQPTRQLMDSLWKLSNASGPDTLRKERGGYLLVDELGIVTFEVSPPSVTDKACETAMVPAPFPPGKTPIASVHVHPFKHGDVVSFCHPGSPGVHYYNGKTRYGFSYKKEKDGTEKGDLVRLANDASQLPALQGMFMMDSTQISFAPRDATVKNIKQKGWTKSRVQPSGCKIA